MHFDHEADARANCFAHGGDGVHHGSSFFGRQVFPSDSERIDLERPITAGGGGASAFGKLCWRARAAVPALRVRLQPLVTAAAVELVHRLAARLADDVPQGDLDA